MIKIRRRDDRGHVDIGWLKSAHSFSFGHYYDPAHVNFGPLRVINEDHVIPGAGFATHPHDNMEIVTYVMDGALEHKDSMGNGSIIRPGDIQRMSAGTGLTHSEYNHSKEDKVHLLQIWFLPQKRDIKPDYEQKSFDRTGQKGKLSLVMSGTKKGKDLVSINQDIDIHVGLLDGQNASLTPEAGRLQWVQVARGQIDLNGQTLKQGDGAAISGEEKITLENSRDAEILLFDMAA